MISWCFKRRSWGRAEIIKTLGDRLWIQMLERSLGGEAEIIKTLGDRLCIQMFERSRGARGNNQDFRGSIILWSSKSEIRFLHAWHNGTTTQKYNIILLSIQHNCTLPRIKKKKDKIHIKRYCREKETINKARNEKETREKDKIETESSITIS